MELILQTVSKGHFLDDLKQPTDGSIALSSILSLKQSPGVLLLMINVVNFAHLNQLENLCT